MWFVWRQPRNLRPTKCSGKLWPSPFLRVASRRYKLFAKTRVISDVVIIYFFAGLLKISNGNVVLKQIDDVDCRVKNTKNSSELNELTTNQQSKFSIFCKNIVYWISSLILIEKIAVEVANTTKNETD